MNQIDFLRNRYPNLTIGFSTHECNDWRDSMLVAYAKGARTFERHIDIEADNIPVSPYCSLPEQVDTWFKAFHKAKELCGASGAQKRMPPTKEVEYLDSLVRGVYAVRDLPEGHILSDDDVYLAVPLQQGQISCRELMKGEVLRTRIAKDEPIMIDAIDSPYASIPSLRALIYKRGLPKSNGKEASQSNRVNAAPGASEQPRPVFTAADKN
jgi:N-acetylneuraminate synthase